jgi:hypothetical protein
MFVLEKMVDLYTVSFTTSTARESDRVESCTNSLPFVVFFFKLKKIGLWSKERRQKPWAMLQDSTLLYKEDDIKKKSILDLFFLVLPLGW